MRVLILTPTAFPAITGNAITAERWRRSLQRKGIDVEVLATESTSIHGLTSQLRAFEPDLIHVHHAFRAGAMLLDSQMVDLSAEIPLVVSPGGTDINHDLQKEDRRETVMKVYRMARAVIAQSREISTLLATAFTALGDRIVHVPQAFDWFGHDPFDLREAAGLERKAVLFFLPAGIRPVKANLECLIAFERVHAARPQSRIVFSGPVLDTDYAAQFERRLKEFHSFARWIPAIPPAAMRSAYEASDIVLNASLSEGLSNALVEAIVTGKPVLASDIPGNWWPVLGEEGDPPAGYLFKREDPDDFTRHALSLIDNKELRNAFSQAGRERARHWPTPEAEAEGLISAYAMALRSSG